MNSPRPPSSADRDPPGVGPARTRHEPQTQDDDRRLPQPEDAQREHRRQSEGRNRERPRQLRRTGRGPDRRGLRGPQASKVRGLPRCWRKPRFRLKASNGEIIAVSQAYADKPSCMKGIASIGSHAPDAEIVIEDPE